MQSRVEGLTERQLRRIEQGECRATAAAITALAKAHGLDANDYMERLTQAMREEKGTERRKARRKGDILLLGF